MKPLRDPEPGQPIRASHLKDAYDAIRELQNISVGPGLTKRQTAGGVNFALQYPRGRGGKVGKPESCSRTEPTQLAHVQGTQDTDDWAKDDDACAADLTVITDIQYDSTSHKLQFRTRTLKFDSCGKLYEVTAESDLVDITTAEECP
jgi:hypothetical protein